jgi:serine/threonine-protein kinase
VSGESSAGPLGSFDEAAFRRRLQTAVGESFEVQRLLGVGGFGAVFAARDVKLQREVAIKVLRPELLASRDTIERFEREARSVAQLRHPNIVPVYQVGEGQGLAWFVMPLVQGETLREVLTREGRLAADDVRRILSEAADGLQVAHERGLVHRDIKPENIMLEGRGRRVLLMDFGIAKALGDPQTGLTGTGMIVGTPQYMSPEQAGSEKDLDHRSDQYSLALLGYRMLTGTDLYEGQSLPSIIRKQLMAEPPDLRRQVSGVPPEMSQAITRALSRERDERFPDMTAFAKALAPREAVRAARPDGIDEIALAPDLPVSRPLLVAGLVGLIVFGAAYLTAYRPFFTPLDLSKDSAWVVGKDFLVSMGAAGSFREAAVHHADSAEANRYLIERLGRGEARRWADQYLPSSHWHLRWFRPGETEEWQVGVAAGGRIMLFDHVLGDEAPGAQLEVDSAQALAAAFVAARGWSLEGMQRNGVESKQRPGRRDHDFKWLRPLPARAGEGGAGATPGGLQLEVSVRGDRVGRLSAYVLVPQNVRRGYEQQRSGRTPLTIVLSLAGVALVVAVAIVQGRSRRLRWRGPFRIAAVVTVAMGVTMAFQTRAATAFTYPTSQPWVTYEAIQFTVQFAAAAFLGGVVLVLLACLEALGRTLAPSCLRGYREITLGRWRGRAIRSEISNGFGIAGLILGTEGLGQLAERVLPGVQILAPADGVGPVDSVAPALNALDVLGSAVMLSALIVMSVLVVRKRVGGVLPAAAILAAMVALLGPSSISPYAVGVAVVFPVILVMALGASLGGWLGLAIGMFVSGCVSMALALLSGVPGYGASGAILLVVAAAPLLLLAAGRKSTATG